MHIRETTYAVVKIKEQMAGAISEHNVIDILPALEQQVCLNAPVAQAALASSSGSSGVHALTPPARATRNGADDIANKAEFIVGQMSDLRQITRDFIEQMARL